MSAPPSVVLTLLVAVAGAFVAVFAAHPVRSAAGLVTAFVGVAGTAAALAVPLVPGLALWVGATAGLSFLVAGVLIGPGEATRRMRATVLGAIAFVPAGLLGGSAIGLFVELAPSMAPVSRDDAYSAKGAAAALIDAHGPAFGLAIVAVTVAVISAAQRLRRRA